MLIRMLLFFSKMIATIYLDNDETFTKEKIYDVISNDILPPTLFSKTRALC